MINVFILSLFLGFSLPGLSKTETKKGPSSSAVLAKVLEKYRKTPLVEMDTKKAVESELLEKTTVYEGTLTLGRGKFRWLTKTPEASEVIFDGKSFYSIQDGQVLRSKVTSNLKQQSLMAVLFNPKKLEDKFDVKTKEEAVKTGTKSPRQAFDLVPKKKDVEITDLQITVNVEAQSLEQISYTDEVGNRIKITMGKPIFRSTAHSESFSYKPKQGEKIIDL